MWQIKIQGEDDLFLLQEDGAYHCQVLQAFVQEELHLGG